MGGAIFSSYETDMPPDEEYYTDDYETCSDGNLSGRNASEHLTKHSDEKTCGITDNVNKKETIEIECILATDNHQGNEGQQAKLKRFSTTKPSMKQNEKFMKTISDRNNVKDDAMIAEGATLMLQVLKNDRNTTDLMKCENNTFKRTTNVLNNSCNTAKTRCKGQSYTKIQQMKNFRNAANGINNSKQSHCKIDKTFVTFQPSISLGMKTSTMKLPATDLAIDLKPLRNSKLTHNEISTCRKSDVLHSNYKNKTVCMNCISSDNNQEKKDQNIKMNTFSPPNTKIKENEKWTNIYFRNYVQDDAKVEKGSTMKAQDFNYIRDKTDLTKYEVKTFKNTRNLKNNLCNLAQTFIKGQLSPNVQQLTSFKKATSDRNKGNQNYCKSNKEFEKFEASVSTGMRSLAVKVSTTDLPFNLDALRSSDDESSTCSRTNMMHNKNEYKSSMEVYDEIVLEEIISGQEFECDLLDEELLDIIEKEMLVRNQDVRWNDVAGLIHAKQVILETVVMPLIMPEYFIGIRRPWKGVLMVGPPGTGKTLLAKAVATECEANFFSVSVSSLTCKYRGDSEKLVRLLFEMAHFRSPSVIFIDEIDALIYRRGNWSEHEASRRIKSEFLVQMDGVYKRSETEENNKVIILATTNVPWDIDEALRRRLEKRIYIPLPNAEERQTLLEASMKDLPVAEDVDFMSLAMKLEGFSGADISNLCREAAMMQLNRLVDTLNDDCNFDDITAEALDVPITNDDFELALSEVKPTIPEELLLKYEEWMLEFGSN